MTRSDLTHLYAYSGLPFSTHETALAELKKALLLDLKSDGAGVLLVNGREWSKNDVLQFFDTPLEEEFDLEAFLLRYPWMNELYTPEKLKYRESLKKIDFSREDFNAFRKSEAPALEERYERQLRARLARHEDHHALGLLLFRHVFDRGFAEMSERMARKMLLERIRVAIARLETTQTALEKDAATKEADFMRFTPFYDLIEEVASSDSELLESLVELYSQVASAVTVTVAYSMIKNLRRFSYSGSSEAYLNSVERQIKDLRAKEEKSNSGGNSFRLVYIILVIVIALIRLVMSVNRSSSHSNQNLINNIQMQVEMNRVLDSMSRQQGGTDSLLIKTLQSADSLQDADTVH